MGNTMWKAQCRQKNRWFNHALYLGQDVSYPFSSCSGLSLIVRLNVDCKIFFALWWRRFSTRNPGKTVSVILNFLYSSLQIY